MGTLEAPRTWAKRHFGSIELAEVRRVARVVTIAEAMATHPGRSIPQMFEHPYEVKAAYHLFSLEEATPAEGEPDDASYARKKRDRESQLWEQATHRMGPKPDGS